jgi:hypothetical protein
MAYRVSRGVRPNPRQQPRPAPVLRVRPLNDRARTFVRHYPTGIGFTDEVNGTPWPDDAFTHRRIRDGDIAVVVTPEPSTTYPSFGDSAPSKRKPVSGL